MPTIAINLAGVESRADLPLGEYVGDIERMKYIAPKQAGKFGQIMATYLVVDGEALGRKQSEFISLSPNAAWRLKAWFEKFGLGEEASLDVDDETDEVTSPDLLGARVAFSVFTDQKDPTRVRTEVTEVLDMSACGAGAVAPQPAAPAAAAPVASAPVARASAPAAAPQRRTLR